MDTTKQAVKEALELVLRSIAPQIKAIEADPKNVFLYDTGLIDPWTHKKVQANNWNAWIRAIPDAIFETPAGKNLDKALKDDPDFKRHIGAYVGAGFHSISWSTELLALAFVQRIAEESRTFDFNSEIFSRLYSSLVKFVTSDKIDCELVIPLYGFESELSNIKLGTSIALDTLKISEMVDYQVQRLIPPLSEAPPKFCLRMPYILPKHIHRDGEWGAGGSDSFERREEVEIDATTCLSVLRLFKDESFVRGTLIHNVNAWTDILPGSWNRMELFPERSLSYRLQEGEVANLQKFWAKAEKARTKRWINVAFRRLGFAEDKRLIEDRLIDLMIAAESMFLNDSAAGELSYRLALRAACYLKKQPLERREIFNLFRGCYDARSTIVHGDAPKITSGNLDAMARALRKHLMDAIHKMIEELAESKLQPMKTLDDHVFS